MTPMTFQPTFGNAAVSWSKMLPLLALSLFAAGCAATSGTSSIPRPGSGIIEYRQVTREAHRAVAVTVESLEALSRPGPQTSQPHPALAGFDRAFSRLELTSVKARARAEAVIARGQTYFDEWQEHLAGVTNQPAAQAESERYARLYDHFGLVRQRSSDVREEFRPFMAKLREFRARLDGTPDAKSPGPLDLSRLDPLTASGKRVLQNLAAVSAALDAAELELKAMLATKP